MRIVKIAVLCCLIAVVAVFISCSSLPRYNIPNERAHIGNNTLDEDTEVHLQGILDKAVQEYRLIGIQVSVKTRDGKIWNGVSGTKDRGRKILMSADDPIRVGSVTKVFTSVIIFRMIENGTLGLDQTINAWFPDIPGAYTVTIRNLLDHSSGIPEILGMNVMMASSFKPHKKWRPEELVRIIKGKKREFAAGASHKYSNSNYILLGLIAEKVTGKPLKDLYREQIIDPLGMRNTYFVPYEDAPANLTNGYDRNLIPLPGYHLVKPDNTSWSTCAFSPGAMVSTASDLLRFLGAIMDVSLISGDSLIAMTSFTEGRDEKEMYNRFFGMGLFRFDVFDGTIGHLGLFIGSEALAIYHPGKRYVITLTSNVSKFEKDRLVADIIRIIGN